MVLPQSVRSVGTFAFAECRQLENANLRAAHDLKELGMCVFLACERLKHVLLGDSLEAISLGCFHQSGIEELEIPNSVRRVDPHAFANSSLRQVRFLGTAESSGDSGQQGHE